MRLFSIAGHLGLDSGIVKFGGRYWEKDPVKLRSVALISLGGAFLSGAILGALLFVSAPWLADEFFKKPDLIPILRGFAVTFPFVTTLRVAAATSSLSRKLLCGAVSEDIAQPILQIGLFLVFFNMGMGLNAAILSIGISYGISAVIGLLCMARSVPRVITFDRIRMDDLVPIIRFSLPAIVGVTLGAFNLWGDRLLIGYFSTETNTGIYQSISVLTMFTTIIVSGFKISIAPTVSRMYHDGEYDGIKTLAKSVTRWTLYISIPILIFVFINANLLITSLFGFEYESGTIPLLILTVGQAFYVAFGVVDQIFLMTGKQIEWTRISAFIFVSTIILDSILIPRANLIGASIVSSAMMLLLGSIATIRLNHHLRLRLFDKYHAKIFIASLITVLIAYPIAAILAFNLLINLLITTVIIYTVFGGLLLASGLEASDKEIIYRIIKKK